jgi:hypothetical protein
MAIMDIDALEKHLQSSLNPVRPNPEFVSHLRYRLATPDSVVVETARQAPIHLLLIIISAGLFLGSFLYWLIRRIF